jgi:RNA polymerase sigma-70 factor (ECF subfamily)
MPNWPESDDTELITRAQDGSTDAFGELYERHAPAIFRYLYTHLDSRLDAEDLTGEVFLRTWQALPKYTERGIPFLAFLFRIARNALIDHYRRSRPPETSASDDYGLTIEDLSPGPAEVIGTRIEHEELISIMGQLREDYRTVLTLRFISELSPDETAEIMQRSPGAVRVLQHRALNALRNLLG